jgi:hypothetical protein
MVSLVTAREKHYYYELRKMEFNPLDVRDLVNKGKAWFSCPSVVPNNKPRDCPRL